MQTQPTIREEVKVPGEGVILPTRRPRLQRIFKTVVSATVFAFTLTSVIPAGYAALCDQERQTLRVKAAQESPVEAGLEEQLRGSHREESVQPVTVASAPIAVPAPELTTPAPAQTLWQMRSTGLEEPMGRRDFLKTGALAAAGTAAAAIGMAATPPVVAQPTAAVPIPAAAPLIVPGPNQIFMNAANGLVQLPSARAVKGPEALKNPDGPLDALEVELQALHRDVRNYLGWKETSGWDPQGRPTRFGPDDALLQQMAEKNPARRRAVTMSAVVWDPWRVDGADPAQSRVQWREIASRMAGVTGYPPGAVPADSTRVYAGAYGLMGDKQPDDVAVWAERQNQLAAQGGLLIPIFGDPTWSESFGAGQLVDQIVRSFQQSLLLKRDSRGRRHLALDIEPYKLPRYQEILNLYETAKKEGNQEEIRKLGSQLAAYWLNIFRTDPDRPGIVLRIQQALSITLQRKTRRSYDDVEITVFVPFWLDEVVEEIRRVGYRLEIPRGVRLQFMAYRNTPDELQKTVARIQKLTGSGGALEGVPYGITVEMGALPEEAGAQGNVSFFGQEAQVSSAGAGLARMFETDPAFTQEYGLHFPDSRLFRMWLDHGGPTEEERAVYRAHRLQLTEKLATVFVYMMGLEPFQMLPVFGELPNGVSAEQAALHLAGHWTQRFVSGAFAGGFGRAVVASPFKTLRASLAFGKPIPIFDWDMPILGPDLGLLYALGLEVWGSRFGEKIKITSLRLVAVDPSRAGKVALTDHTGAVMEQVDGKRMFEDELIADGRDPTADLRVNALPSSGYDLYFLITVQAPPDAKEETRGEGGIRIYNGKGDPVFVDAEEVSVRPGQTRTTVARLLVAKDKRHIQDPQQRPGRVQNMSTVQMVGVFVNTSRAVSEGLAILDAVGLPGYDATALSRTLVSPRVREELTKKVEGDVRQHQMSVLAPESVARDLAVYVQLAQDQDPAQVVRDVAKRRDIHGINAICCQFDVLTPLVYRFQQEREARKRPVYTPQDLEDLLRQVFQDPAARAALNQIRDLLLEAVKQKLRVLFFVDAAKLSATRFVTDSEQADYFFIVSILTETAALGLDTVSGVVVQNPFSLQPQARTRVAEAYLDGEVPIFFSGKNSQPLSINGFRVRQMMDVTSRTTVADAVKALREDQETAFRRHEGAGPALVSLKQLQTAEQSAGADPSAFIERLLQAAVDPFWLDGLMRQPRAYLSQPQKTPLEFSNIRELTGLHTGVLHPIASLWDNHPGRMTRLIVRIRGTKIDDSQQSVLLTSDVPVIPGELDLPHGISLSVGGFRLGPYILQREMLPAGKRPAPPGEDASNIPALAVVRAQKNAVPVPVPLNSGSPSRPILNPVDIGNTEVEITLDPMDGHRLIHVAGKTLHIQKDVEGDVRFWLEGQPRPDLSNLERPTAIADPAVERVKGLEGQNVRVEMEGELGLVTVWVGEGSVQILETAQIKNWSKRDSPFVVEEPGQMVRWGAERPKVPQPSGQVLDMRKDSVTPYPELWRDFWRPVIRYIVPYLLLTHLVRHLLGISGSAKDERVFSRLQREGQVGAWPAKPVDWNRRIGGFFWCCFQIAAVGLILTQGPALAPIFGPLLLSPNWTGLSLAVKLAVGLPMLGKFVVDGVGSLLPTIFGRVMPDRLPWPIRLAGLIFPTLKSVFKPMMIGAVTWIGGWAVVQGVGSLPALFSAPVGSVPGAALAGGLIGARVLLGVLDAFRRGDSSGDAQQRLERTGFLSERLSAAEVLLTPLVTAGVLAGFLIPLLGVPALSLPTGMVFAMFFLLGLTQLLSKLLAGTFRLETRPSSTGLIRYLRNGRALPDADQERARQMTLRRVDWVVRVFVAPVAAAGLIALLVAGSNGWLLNGLSATFRPIVAEKLIHAFGSGSAHFWVGVGTAAILAVGTVSGLLRRIILPVVRRFSRSLPGPLGAGEVEPTVSQWAERALLNPARQGVMTSPGGPHGGDALRFYANPAGQAALRAQGFDPAHPEDLQQYGTPEELDRVSLAFAEWLNRERLEPAVRSTNSTRWTRRILRGVQRFLQRRSAQSGLEELRLSTDRRRRIEREMVRLGAMDDTEQFLQENKDVFPPPDPSGGERARLTALIRSNAALAEDLINFYAFRRQVARYLIQLDFQGMLKTGGANWDFQDMVDRLKRDDRFHAVMPRIVVEPRSEPALLGRGLGAGMVPFNWFSQALQYEIAGGGWRPLRRLEDPQNVINLAWGQIESGMEPDIENMLGHQLPRWGFGHMFIEMLAYGGITFHRDPNALRPSGFRRWFDGVRSLVIARLNRGSPETLAAGYLAASEPPYPRNLEYGAGRRSSFAFIARRRWSDDGYNDPPDSRAIQQDHLDPDTWMVRLLGRDNVQIYAPFSYAVQNGEVVSSTVPSKFAARFSPAGWQPVLTSPTKAYRMALALEIIERSQNVQPTILTGDGGQATNVVWTSVTTTDEFQPEMMGGRETVEGRERTGRSEGLDVFRNLISNVVWSDGSVHRPEETPPQGIRVVGPVTMGHDAYDNRTGRWWIQWMFLAADWITGAKGRYQSARARRLYNFSPSFWIAITLLGLSAVGVLAPAWWVTAGIWAGFLFSRHLLGPLLRNMHPLAMWRYRRIPISAGFSRSYQAGEIVDLVGRGTGRPIQIPLPDRQISFQDRTLNRVFNPRTDPGYIQLLEMGATLLSRHQLMPLAERLALTFTGQDFRQDRQRRPAEWEQQHAEALRAGIQQAGIRPGSDEFLAIQYAVLELINGTHLAVGNPLAGYLAMGPSHPGVLRGEENYPFDRAPIDPELLAIGMNDRGENVPYQSQMTQAGTPTRETRSWFWTSSAAEEQGHSVQMAPDPEQALRREQQRTGLKETENPPAPALARRNVLEVYLEYARPLLRAGQTPLSPRQFFGRHSALPPDNDTLIRQSNLRMGELLTQEAGPMAWALSPDARFAGYLLMGGDTEHLIVLDRVLHEVSHALIQPGHRGFLPSLGRWVDRAAGFGGSIGIGVWTTRLLQSALVAAGLPSGAIAWGIAGLLAGGPALYAALRALFAERKDQWVVHGSYGEGVRAIALIPGFWQNLILKNPLPMLSVKWWLLTLNHHLPYPIRTFVDVPWSTDLRVAARAMGLPPEAFLGYVSHMQYPFLVGTAYAPGKQWGRYNPWDWMASKWEANPVPAVAALWLRRMQPHTRILSGLNYLPSEAWDVGRALAEDTLFGWNMAYHTVLEPMTPAVSVHRVNYLLSRFEELRSSQQALQGALQFSYGMDLADALKELARSTPVKNLTPQSPLEQRLSAFAARLWAFRAFKQDEVDTGSRRGAGQISYLFFNFTLNRLYPKLVQIFAPGQIEALKTYMAYEAVDQMLGGALARQMFQMNADLPGNPLHGLTQKYFDQMAQQGSGAPGRPDPSLANPAIRALLLRGWFVDPLAALVAVKARIHHTMAARAGSAEALRSAARKAAEVFHRHEGGSIGNNGWSGRVDRILKGTWDDVEVRAVQETLTEFSGTDYAIWLREATREFKPLPHIGQTQPIDTVSVRTMSGLWGKYKLTSTDNVPNLRRINDIWRREGKMPIIFMRRDITELAADIGRFPRGGRPGMERAWGPARPESRPQRLLAEPVAQQNEAEPEAVAPVEVSTTVPVSTSAAPPAAQQTTGLEENPPVTQTSFQSSVTTAANVPEEIRVAVIPGESVQGTELAPLAGTTRQIGPGRWLMVLPTAAGAEELSDQVAPFMAESNVVFVEFGDPAALTRFHSMVQGLATVHGPFPLNSAKGRILRQIWANLAGLEENAVSDEEVLEVKGALGLLGSQV